MKTKLSNKARGVMRRMNRGRAGADAEYADLPLVQQQLISEAVEQSLTRKLAAVDETIRQTEAKLQEGHQERAKLAAHLERTRRMLGMSV